MLEAPLEIMLTVLKEPAIPDPSQMPSIGRKLFALFLNPDRQLC